MGYLNEQVGYRKDILSTRSIIKKNNYAIIDPDGLVKNVIPGFTDCDITILATPEIGASYVDYIITLKENGGNKEGFGEEDIELFIYVLEGSILCTVDGKEYLLEKDGYLFIPEGKKLYFKNNDSSISKAYLYKRIYDRLDGYKPYVYVGNANDVEYYKLEEMSTVGMKDLLPKDLSFDMNFHILSFKPGASHGYLETHIQEHGAYVINGKGMYNFDNEWIPVKKGDYLYMSPYSIQGAYGVGDEDFIYLYSKDCNRDYKLKK